MVFIVLNENKIKVFAHDLWPNLHLKLHLLSSLILSIWIALLLI
jgi:hypothetical protein